MGSCWALSQGETDAKVWTELAPENSWTILVVYLEPVLYDIFQTHFWLIPWVLGTPALTSPYCTIVLLSCRKFRKKSTRHCTRPQTRSAVEILEPLKFIGSLTINIDWLAQDAWGWIPFKLQSCSMYQSSFFKDPERLWRRTRNDFIKLYRLIL